MNAVSPVVTLVTDHLDLWTTALKRKSTAGRGSSSKVELYGIKKLRELILELAVRGLLVPQDPNDEPASELLKKIAAEKARLVKEGKIKKDKPLPPIDNDEKPFLAPNSWQFVRLLSLSHEIGTGPFGSMIHQSDYVPGGIPLVNPSHMIGDLIVEDISVAVDQQKAKELSSYRLYEGDIVLARRGEVGRCAIVTGRENGWLCGTGSFYLRLPPAISRRFSALFFRATSTRVYLAGKAVGTTMVNLNHGILNNLPVALPPIAEQHRIVAKVDELMALCDQLEQQTDASLGAHQTLVETLLSALTSAADHAQFASAWQRIAGHFDTLFTTEESIAQLKQTILQLAVMGKLVPQDPNDEPASELLKKIAAEKAKLVKEGKIKADKPLTPISEEKPPFKVPLGWAAARLGEVIKISSGDGLTSAQMAPQGRIPVYGGNGVNGYHDQANVSKPTLVIGRVGFYCGSIHITPDRAWITDNAFLTSFSEELFTIQYLALLLQGTNLKENENATAQPVISGKKVYPIPVCFPPVSEQHRIVAKVDELTALCDQLKSRLSDAQTTQLRLADALVERAIG